ncbi:MAG: chloride channel protein, partial [Gammaproteobacteria bacterium]
NPLESLRQRLARADALLPLALVGAVSGIATGAVIIAFRLVSESALPAAGVLANPEDFESLSPGMRFGLPVLGALLIAALYARASLETRRVGVVHVMERLISASGRMPWRNAVLQFVGGAISLMCGHSVGREGPGIHLGAAASSLLGQHLGLPNNSLRILVACGVAASIAASFNTPIAGVIFAMEVVMMEYTIIGFTPVILAAVFATSMSRMVYGGEPAFDVPPVNLESLWEMPYAVVVGVCLGALGAGFGLAVTWMERSLSAWPFWLRMVAAGVVTGLCALAAPEIMGIGYDTVNRVLNADIALSDIATVVVLKLVATVACVAMALPGGLIGPVLVIGALAGGALGAAGHAVMPVPIADVGLYAIIGIGAMMGATLQAPLAALMAALELTGNSNVILPGMLAIVSATLTARVVFRQESVFVRLLRQRGLEYRVDPVAVSLHRTAVGAVMSRRFATTERHVEREQLETLLARASDWILVANGQQIVSAIPSRRFAHLNEALERGEPDGTQRTSTELAGTEHDVTEPASKDAPDIDRPPIDLLSDERTQLAFATVRLQATLSEALERMEAEQAETVLVTRGAVALRQGVYGVLSRDQIEASVRFGS